MLIVVQINLVLYNNSREIHTLNRMLKNPQVVKLTAGGR